MDPVVVSTALGFLTSVLAGSLTSSLGRHADRVRRDEASSDDTLKAALGARRTISAELGLACAELARRLAELNRDATEPLQTLLVDETFQSDLEQWLILGRIPEGIEVNTRLRAQLTSVALASGVERPDAVVEDDLGRLERMVFASPVLSAWTQQRSIDHLRAMLGDSQRLLRLAAGEYDQAERDRVSSTYIQRTLGEHDIIDLTGLPEDISTATVRGLLRHLYMPLRLNMEPETRSELARAIASMEDQRKKRLDWESGRRDADQPSERQARPLGAEITDFRRVMVLGDPGAGKTTLLRWLATAMLLRLEGHDELSGIPDTDTLPDDNWLPVLIRCREIADADRTRGFVDFLGAYLRTIMPTPKDAEVMRAVILDGMSTGKVLLLVDGLDEIQDPIVRARFAREVDRVAARFPDAPVVVTSRVVGYRDMPHRLGDDFRHGMISDLTDDDKRDFASRWIEATESGKREQDRKRLADELAKAFDVNDRVRRMTGNAMLLTTLALVKRRVGKLPNRRHKLYFEAVSVLLNFNPEHPSIDEDEALPQLGYVAHAMCKRGEQQIREDDLLDLLDDVRKRFPNLRAVKRRTAEDFLRRLEARSGIIMKVGGVWHDKKGADAMWEFRHLTFQEYLAARAILKRHHMDVEESPELAPHVADLVGQLEKVRDSSDWAVPERWREALRLVVVETPAELVDSVFDAILDQSAQGDEPWRSRARAVFAAMCLADEPDVSDAMAARVIARFVDAVQLRSEYAEPLSDDGSGHVQTTLDKAAVELGMSEWRRPVQLALMARLRESTTNAGTNDQFEEFMTYGGVHALLDDDRSVDSADRVRRLADALASDCPDTVTGAALQLMDHGFLHSGFSDRYAPTRLIGVAASSDDLLIRYCACWALGWAQAAGRSRQKRKAAAPWSFTKGQLETLADLAVACGPPDARESVCVRWLRTALENSASSYAGELLLDYSNSRDDAHAASAADAAKRIARKLGQEGLFAVLPKMLAHRDATVRKLGYARAGRRLDRGRVLELIGLYETHELDSEVLAQIAATRARLGDEAARKTLRLQLEDENPTSRRRAMATAASVYDPAEQLLLTEEADGHEPWLDPREPISADHIAACASRLSEDESRIRERFKRLSAKLGVTLKFADDA